MAPKSKKPRISPQLYLNPTQQETHENFFSEKQVISERYIDYESFPNYPIAQCFSGKNMIKSLLHIRGKAPISPVLLFYSQIHNLSDKDQSFDTYIEGKVHKITPQLIASLLDLERPSNPVSFPPTVEDDLVVSKEEFRRAVFLPDHVNSGSSRPKVSHLKPIIAALVRICKSNILPVLSHHHLTNMNSVYLSFLLLNGYQVDISYVIWHTMSRVVSNCGRTKAVPYGILVGRLLSYLGHSFPADTPCTSVPAKFDAHFLLQNHLPCDPCESNDRPLSEPHSDEMSPPLAPPSTDQDDASELPPETIQSLKETVEIILSHIITRLDRFEQQQEEMIDRIAREDDRHQQQHEQFMQQKKIIEDIAYKQQQHEEFSKQHKLIIDGIVTRQKHFQKQLQEMIGRSAREDGRREQQHEESMQQKKIIEDIAHQQDLLQQQHEESSKQQKLIVDGIATRQDQFQQQHEELSKQHKLTIDGIVTRQEHFQKQLQEIIDRVARQDGLLEQQQEEFMRYKKTNGHISHQQDHLQQKHDELSKEHKLIINGIVNRQDDFEQQLQEMTDRIGRKDGHLEQQNEEFMQQKKTIGHIVHPQEHLQQEHEQQQQEMINRVALQDGRIEHQGEEIAQLHKHSEGTANQQDRLELQLEEFKQQQKIIDCPVTQQDQCEHQNRKMIASIARKHDGLAPLQDQHHTLLTQQVNPICQECGDSGYAELLIYCNLCQTSAEHSYCSYKIPRDGDYETIWTCEECERTAKFKSQRGLQITSVMKIPSPLILSGGEWSKESEKLDADEQEGVTPAC